MVKLVWTEPALADLQALADDIALDNPEAARRLVSRLFKHIDQLRSHPKSGSVPSELRPSKTYRQIVEPSCRVFYRVEKNTLFVVHVMRGERMLHRQNLRRR